MLEYDRISISEGTDINTSKIHKQMLDAMYNNVIFVIIRTF